MGALEPKPHARELFNLMEQADMETWSVRKRERWLLKTQEDFEQALESNMALLHVDEDEYWKYFLVSIARSTACAHISDAIHSLFTSDLTHNNMHF